MADGESVARYRSSRCAFGFRDARKTFVADRDCAPLLFPARDEVERVSEDDVMITFSAKQRHGAPPFLSAIVNVL